MNTHADYRRHAHQPETAPATPPEAAEVNEIAQHGDPPLTQPPATTLTGRRIAWVRPTELHAYAGNRIGRGIDLQSELMRRAQQAPRTVVRAIQAAPASAPNRAAQAPNQAPNLEGLQL